MKVFFFSGWFVNMFNTKKRFQGYFIQKENQEVVGYLEEEKNKSHVDAIRGVFDEENRKLLLVKTTQTGGFVQEIYMFIFQGDFKGGKLSTYNHGYKTFSAYGGVTSNGVGLDVLTSVPMSEENIRKTKVMYDGLYETSTQLSKELAGDVKKYMWLFDYLKHFERSAK